MVKTRQRGKRKLLSALIAAAGISLLFPGAARAGQWRQENVINDWQSGESSYWYQEDDGTYPADAWKWIDGRCYYFNQEGWMLSDTVTPDGYRVDAGGAWIPDLLEAYPVRIHFSTMPFHFIREKTGPYVTERRETIDAIVQALGGLQFKEVLPEDDTLLDGMSSELIVIYPDGTSELFSFCNPLFTGKGRYSWITAGNPGLINGAVYRDYMLTMQEEGRYQSLPPGKVSEIATAESGASASFVLTPSSGTSIRVDCSDADIFDNTGHGWLILHEGDIVSVLYDKIENGICKSSNIFIQKLAEKP